MRASSERSSIVDSRARQDKGSALAQNKVLMQRAFHDVLSRSGQISDAVPCRVSGDGGREPICLASAFLARGKSIPFADFLTCVTTAQKSNLRFPSWNPDACKVC